MVLLNIRTEITLPSGFEMSVCKMQKDPRSSRLSKEYKVWLLLCWPGSALSLSFSVVFLLGTGSIVYPCPVFAQLPSTDHARLFN